MVRVIRPFKFRNPIYISSESERELTFTFAVCCRSSICLSSVWRLSACLSVSLSSVTFVHPTQAVVILGNITTAFGIPWPSIDMHENFYGDRPRETPPSWELNTIGVAKYSDFGPIEGYVSEKVQDRK